VICVRKPGVKDSSAFCQGEEKKKKKKSSEGPLFFSVTWRPYLPGLNFKHGRHKERVKPQKGKNGSSIPRDEITSHTSLVFRLAAQLDLIIG